MSGTAEAEVVKFCVLAGYVKYYPSDHSWKGRGPGHVIRFRILHVLNFSGMAKDRIVKFYA